MKLQSKDEAVKHIKENYNFRGAIETNGPPNSQNIQNAYFIGEPVIDSEEDRKRVKAWKYHWPEEDGVFHWITDDGEKHAEADIDAEMELLAQKRNS